MAAINERTYFGFRRTTGDASEGGSKGVPALLVPTTDRHMHFASAADEATDWAITNPTHPRFFIHSETTPATNYGFFEHDATNFIINSNAGGVHFPVVVGVVDDVSLELGTDDDSVFRHRTAVLAANTALTDVLVGTPVSTALPANSLIVSNVTADGDIGFYLRSAAGANSEEYLRFDASARETVVNDASVDMDFRVESDTNASMLFVDGGNNAIGIGSSAGTVLTDVTLYLAPPAHNQGTFGVRGSAVTIDTATITDNATAASGTNALMTYVSSRFGTFAALNTAVTITDAATLYVEAAPTAGTNVTLTRAYGLLVDAGQFRVDSNVQVNNTATFATTQPTASIVFQSGTAPAGAITTGGALYTSTTAIRKIIAAGTDSLVET